MISLPSLTRPRASALGAALCAGLALSQPGPAWAQATATPPQRPASTNAPPAAPAPVTADPQSTTASFGDWLLRCVRPTDPPQAPRVCEVAQTLQVQGQQGPIAQVAFGRAARNEPLRAVVILPTNMSLPSSVRLQADENDAQPLDLAWRRCIPGACVAEADPTPAAMQRLRARQEAGRLTYRDAGGRDVALPLSLRGLAQALDAMQRETN